MCPPKRQRTVCRGRSRLGDERRSKRVLAGDEEFVATIKSFDVLHVRWTVGLLVPAVAPGTRQDQVPHPVDRSTTNLGADRPGEDMVDLRLAVRRAIGGDRQVAIEAGALLVAVEGPLVSISAAGLPRSQAIDLCMAIR